MDVLVMQNRNGLTALELAERGRTLGHVQMLEWIRTIRTQVSQVKKKETKKETLFSQWVGEVEDNKQMHHRIMLVGPYGNLQQQAISSKDDATQCATSPENISIAMETEEEKKEKNNEKKENVMEEYVMEEEEEDEEYVMEEYDSEGGGNDNNDNSNETKYEGKGPDTFVSLDGTVKKMGFTFPSDIKEEEEEAKIPLMDISTPSYVCRSDVDMIQHLYNMCVQFAEIVDIPISTNGTDATNQTKDRLFVYLDRYNFNLTSTISNWIKTSEDNPMMVDTNILPIIGYSNVDANKTDNSSAAVCAICSEDSTETSLTALNACGHVFCLTCWKYYINNAMLGNIQTFEKNRFSLLLQCPHHNCETSITMKDCSYLGDVDLKVVHSRVTKRYVNLSANTIRGCPLPDCQEWICFLDLHNNKVHFKIEKV